VGERHVASRIISAILPVAFCFLTIAPWTLAPALAGSDSQKSDPILSYRASYHSYADRGMAALVAWYDPDTALWRTTGWWNAANALKTVVDYAALTRNPQYTHIIANTFDEYAHVRFINDYYDDEGWWALAWIKAYDLTGDARYLHMAQTLFADMTRGWDTTCAGGIWWTKDRDYKNAIANEVFLAVAARLHLRTPPGPASTEYLRWAQREWDWFRASGMINSASLINDGLTDGCRNNGQDTWSYNQGVILGGLVDLYYSTGDPGLLDAAQDIADAAIINLTDTSGILREEREPDGHNSGDQPQFKGIFMRNLSYLYSVTHNPAYRDFILRNAAAVWRNSRTASNQFGSMWTGPVAYVNAATHSSAQDAIHAALRIEIAESRNTRAPFDALITRENYSLLAVRFPVASPRR
jgi:predicted alpha-1,6-mannanase (GH76 family)